MKQVHTLAIIQARMNSARLPGKVLELIGSRSMLAHVIARAARARLVNHVCVATTNEPEDDAIANACKAMKVDCLRPNLDQDNVVGRYRAAAEFYRARAVVRITADCPLLDPAVIDRVITGYQRGADYCSNVSPRTFPDGLDVEVLSMGLLRRLDERAQGVEREHVTARIWREPHRCGVIRSVTDTVDLSRLRWTVDTADDLAFVRDIYARMNPINIFGMEDVLNLGDVALRVAAAA